jgi:Outer membrane protein (OmpH-like)
MKTALLASLGLAAVLSVTAQPAFAQTAAARRAPAAAGATAPIVPGLGIANIEAIRQNSNAFRVAEQQRVTTYQAVTDQARTRAQQLDAQLAPLADRIRAAQAAPNASTPAATAAIQAQIAQYQQLQQAGQAEIQQIMLPIQMSKAFTDEQINEKLGQAVEQAVVSRRISLLIPPDVILHADNAYNMNQPILDALNVLVPSVQIVPPAGWEPREIREQRAQAAAAAAAAGQAPAAAAGQTPAPAPAGPLPDGR